jgi:calcineurin-like phosphoesterase family protein
MSIAVVGDIHGEAVLLEKMWRRLASEGRTVIFAGDYVNRGPQSKEVIALLTDIRSSTPNVVFLWGNHEISLLNYLCRGKFKSFLQLGGLATLQSYLKNPFGDVHSAFLNAFPESHRKFLSQLRRCYETPDLLVSHAGCDPLHPRSRSFRALVTGHHGELFRSDLQLPKRVVCGHYVQRSGIAYASTFVICIDTGCGVGGPLTAILLPERKILTVPS